MARASLRPPRAAHDEPEAPLRPTRAAPAAPLAPAPRTPRVAPAPRVIGPPPPRARPSASLRRRGEPTAPHALWIVRLPLAPELPSPSIVAALGAAGAIDVRALAPRLGPTGGARALLARLAVPAVALGAAGAALGALAFAGGEATLAPIGWLPGSVVGGAACAGVLGAVALAIAASIEALRAARRSRALERRWWALGVPPDREREVARTLERARAELVAIAAPER